MQTEEELDEVALLRYAQQRAAKWGAERFAAEFARRDLEERWLEAARANTTPHSPATVASADRGATVPGGPVDAGAQDHAVGYERDAWVLSRPKHGRHASVPRPPAEPEPDGERRRFRRRRRERPSASRFVIRPAEAARMSAAGRRLYGLDEPREH